MALRTTPITLGAAALGAAGMTDADADAVAEAMLVGPHRFVDTSRAYADGRSEGALGRARRALGDARRAEIVTKIDADPHTGALDRDRVRRSFEASCTALGVERLPLVHLHDPYTVTLARALRADGAVAGLVELRDAGLVDAIGIAAGPVPLLSDYVATGVFDAVLVHNRFTLVDRTAVPLLEDARRRGMTTFAAAPFGGGILAHPAGSAHGARYAYRPASPELAAWVGSLGAVCDRHGVPPAAAALRFSLRSPLVDSTVVGIRTPRRLAELARLVAAPIPPELWAEVDALGPAPSPIDDAHDTRGRE